MSDSTKSTKVYMTDAPQQSERKPINLVKYPQIKQMYDMVREIDSLPASTEATNLVVKASALMGDLWNFLEENQPKYRLAHLLKEALEAKYMGKSIRSQIDANRTFKVEVVAVEMDGPDPQMNVKLTSKTCEEETVKWRDWQLKNNPMGVKNHPRGGATPPAAIELPFRDACKECFYMSQLDDVMPEILS